jgi:hypothetical protein
MTAEIVECLYCNADAPNEAPPALDDDRAWQRLAADHAPDCEWIMSRAHRLDDDEQRGMLLRDILAWAEAGDTDAAQFCARRWARPLRVALGLPWHPDADVPDPFDD